MDLAQKKYRLVGAGIVVGCFVVGLAVKAARGFPDSVEMPAYKVLGNPQAKHYIVEYSNFGCIYCKKLAPVMKELLASYPNDLKLVHKHYQLSIMPPEADKAAEATECAGDQGRYWDYAYKLYGDDSWFETPKYMQKLVEFAQDIKLDTAKFRECLESGEKAKIVIKDSEEAARFFIQGTPTLVLDGRKILTSKELEDLKAAMDEVIAADRG